MSPKSIFVRNNDKYEVCIPITYLFLCIMPFVMLVYLFCSTKGLGGEGRERELPRKWVHRKMLRVMFQNWSVCLNLVFPAIVLFGTQMILQKSDGTILVQLNGCLLHVLHPIRPNLWRPKDQNGTFGLGRALKWILSSIVTQLLVLLDKQFSVFTQCQNQQARLKMDDDKPLLPS